MRKKLDTRFPAARIKKIMQADEDVGKIAMAVPVLVSKALELFLQDLCDRTYDITLQRGAKTMSALHLKHCVQSYNVFDFLREVVSKVPDYGHCDAAAEDRIMSKRRKAAGDEFKDSDEELKRSQMHDTNHASSSGRGRGRGRRRGRGRGRASYREHDVEIDSCTPAQQGSTMENPITGRPMDSDLESKEIISKETIKVASDGANPAVQTIDLNAELGDNTDKASSTIDASAASSATPTSEVKSEEYPGWSLTEMGRVAFDPLHFAQLNTRLDEDEDDYDEEG